MISAAAMFKSVVFVVKHENEECFVCPLINGLISLHLLAY